MSRSMRRAVAMIVCRFPLDDDDDDDELEAATAVA